MVGHNKRTGRPAWRTRPETIEVMKSKAKMNKKELSPIMAQEHHFRQLQASPGITAEMRRNEGFRRELRQAVRRFLDGDWGDGADPMEWGDQEALASEEKILGSYRTGAGRVWVTAEPAVWDGEILFQFEY